MEIFFYSEDKQNKTLEEYLKELYTQARDNSGYAISEGSMTFSQKKPLILAKLALLQSFKASLKTNPDIALTINEKEQLAREITARKRFIKFIDDNIE